MSILLVSDNQFYAQGLVAHLNTKSIATNHMSVVAFSEMSHLNYHHSDVFIICLESFEYSGLCLHELFSKISTTFGKILFISNIKHGANYWKSTDFNKVSIKDNFNVIFKKIDNHSRIKPLMKPELTHKERLVFNFCLQGYSGEVIANKLNLSSKTISTMKYQVLRKLGVKYVNHLILSPQIIEHFK